MIDERDCCSRRRRRRLIQIALAVNAFMQSLTNSGQTPADSAYRSDEYKRRFRIDRCVGAHPL